MCGIAAIVTRRTGDLAQQIDGMTDSLIHRGPDDGATLALESDGVALGIRRLSILDIETGQQPMWDEARRHVIVFNGEIYNYQALRNELSALGHQFVTNHSDTEALVHGYEEWGEGLFAKLNGMFALAIWDRSSRQLVVARDRAGEKPLYVARVPDGYAIASELKALLRLPLVTRELNLAAIDELLSFDFILPPGTIFKNIWKLPPGHLAIIEADRYSVRPYWSLAFRPRPMKEEDAVGELDRLLDRSIQLRMVADVPVGLFLSGGLDSTTVGYYLGKHRDRVQSFSIGFEDRNFDESKYAQIAADHLGTEHHLEVFSEQQIAELVPRIADILDEPMADQSIFPTYLLSRLAKQRVKVALGGDGSDELLMGYKTYKALKLAWQFDRLPDFVRSALSNASQRLPDAVGRKRLRGKHFIDRLDKQPVERLLSSLGSYGGNGQSVLSAEIIAELRGPRRDLEDRLPMVDAAMVDPSERTIAAYLGGYLQEDILVKIDRASMAVSLEVRSPFLDPDIIDFLACVPTNLKLRGLTGKYLLRKVMQGRIPDAIINRPKQGFGLPLSTWLRASLAGLVREYLDAERLRKEGIFDPRAVGQLVKSHLSGERDYGQRLWPLLLYQLWSERWVPSGRVSQVVTSRS